MQQIKAKCKPKCRRFQNNMLCKSQKPLAKTLTAYSVYRMVTGLR